MSTQQQTSRSSGIGFGGALALLFIGLKLGHVIGWSWWWVLAIGWLLLFVQAVTLFVIGVSSGWCWQFATLLAAFFITLSTVISGEIQLAQDVNDGWQS